MSEQNTRLGIILMIVAAAIFSVQDAISRHLGDNYNVLMIVMIRYWFFGLFVMTISARMAGGIRPAARTGQLWVQILRGTILAAEILTMIYAFTLLGLVETHAVFACYPLLIAALSGPVLGEKVGWRRWVAIGIGFCGILVILEPGIGVFRQQSLVALGAALMFALYGLLTRFAARRDSAATSFFWTGVVGMVITTTAGVWFWEPMTGPDWIWMGILCLTGATGHYTLIKVYDVAEASAVQPFAYLQLPFATILGVSVFGDPVRSTVAVGALLVVGAGLFTLFRERKHA